MLLYKAVVYVHVLTATRCRGGENQVASIISEANALVITFALYRGSYMSAHVLLNLLNEVRKSEEI